jgi:hypothetical protein
MKSNHLKFVLFTITIAAFMIVTGCEKEGLEEPFGAICRASILPHGMKDMTIRSADTPET